jgi:hypothetical protein
VADAELDDLLADGFDLEIVEAPVVDADVFVTEGETVDLAVAGAFGQGLAIRERQLSNGVELMGLRKLFYPPDGSVEWSTEKNRQLHFAITFNTMCLSVHNLKRVHRQEKPGYQVKCDLQGVAPRPNRVSPTGQPAKRCHILGVKPRPKLDATKLDLPLLEKGQVWNMQDEQLRINRTGKHLVEFRILKLGGNTRPQRLARSSLETVTAVQNYLQTRQAVLQPVDEE